MYKHFERAIRSNPTDLSGILDRIDAYHIGGKLTDAEHDALVELARGAAQPQLDQAAEIQRLWAAVHALQAELAALKGGAAGEGGAADGAEVAEYVQPTGAHDAYYAGAVVSWNGGVYTCVAPEGVACVWSPEVMPGHWQLLAAAEVTGDD